MVQLFCDIRHMICYCVFTKLLIYFTIYTIMPQKPKFIYFEHQANTIDIFEALPDDDDFAELLERKSVELTDSMRAEEGTHLTVDRDIFPDSLRNGMLLPARVTLTGLQSQLTQPTGNIEENDGTPEWALATSFSLSRDIAKDPTGTKFTVISTPRETTFTTTNLSGDLLVLSGAPAADGQKLLMGLLSTRIAQEAPPDDIIHEYFARVAQDDTVSLRDVRAALMGLGQRLGTYQKITHSYLTHPDQGDRALVVRVKDVEHLGAQNRTYDFSMNSQFTSGLKSDVAQHTATISLRQQSINHNASTLLESSDRQSGKRFPTDIPVEEMLFATRLGMFNHTDERVFDPFQDREQYGLVAEAIMTVIEPNLKLHRQQRTQLPPTQSDSYEMPDPS